MTTLAMKKSHNSNKVTKSAKKKISADFFDQFRNGLLEWFKIYRRDFPWRSQQKDPFHVLIAEILLQKTNAVKVEKIFVPLTERFRTPNETCTVNVSELEAFVKPLGLIYKARRLHNIACSIVFNYASIVPQTISELLSLDGVGNYIANAVLCFGYSQRRAIVDSNVVRIYDRVFSVKSSKRRARDDTAVWAFAEMMLPLHEFQNFNYALLDFASIVCTHSNPKHEICPFTSFCHYNRIEND